MERTQDVCCRDCSLCKLPQATSMNTMVACAIDQMFQRQLRQDEILQKIADAVMMHPDESINLAKVTHLKDEENETLDVLQDPGKDGEE